MEKNLRRSLALSGGEWGILFSSPIAVGFWILALGFILGPPLMAFRTRLKGVDAGAG
jgi:putative tricarboxylic transport membrane protein